MSIRILVWVSAGLVLGVTGMTSRGEEDRPGDAARKAVERGLGFLEKDALKWRKDRECATCHHGTMTVWALSEARGRGYEVAADALAETAKWTKGRLLERID